MYPSHLGLPLYYHVKLLVFYIQYKHIHGKVEAVSWLIVCRCSSNSSPPQWSRSKLEGVSPVCTDSSGTLQLFDPSSWFDLTILQSTSRQAATSHWLTVHAAVSNSTTSPKGPWSSGLAPGPPPGQGTWLGPSRAGALLFPSPLALSPLPQPPSYWLRHLCLLSQSARDW